MIIKKVNIENYRCFYGQFSIELNPNVNILVGDNESGKSTILEAINLALTGVLNGRYFKNELSPYLFNHKAVLDYVESLNQEDSESQLPPHIKIEVFLDGDDASQFRGTGNSERVDACGLSLILEFDNNYQPEYEELVSAGELNTIPIEYYQISWRSFAREVITARSIPVKSVLIDSSCFRYQNGSDVYISRIIQADLDDADKAAISQEYRKMKEMFGDAESVKAINEKIKTKSRLTDKELTISVNLGTYNSWQTTLMTYLDEIPFHFVGKGDQCIVKTNLALGHQKSQEANLILLEEPENHLSHTRLNQLLANISAECENKQIIITTHSSFVANKLGIDHIIFLAGQNTSRFTNLNSKTYNFFRKLPGYQTLRLLLCRKAVLVEGPSDELIFQKAYMAANSGRIPIEDGIDVISVGLSFKRFLEVSKSIHQPTAVVTDNDENYDQNINTKYSDYSDLDFIAIFADEREELPTLEPLFIEANNNGIEGLCEVLDVDYEEHDPSDRLLVYMKNNKTDWALKIFESTAALSFPKYICDAVEWCNE